MLPNANLVHVRLEASRHNLLDLSLRNRLLNYRLSRSVGLELTWEDPTELLRLLVVEGRSLTFVADPPKARGDGPEGGPEQGLEAETVAGKRRKGKGTEARADLVPEAEDAPGGAADAPLSLKKKVKREVIPSELALNEPAPTEPARTAAPGVAPSATSSAPPSAMPSGPAGAVPGAPADVATDPAARGMADRSAVISLEKTDTSASAGSSASSSIPSLEGPHAAAPRFSAAGDARLSCAETPAVLKTRLLKTWRDAQSLQEEQGVNVLFLALGMLDWVEEGETETRRAPLVLIPVTLERGSGNVFRLRHDGAEVGGNQSLKARLAGDFHLLLPDLEDPEPEALEPYFSAVAEAVAGRPGFKVDPGAVVLGFFSYARYLMFKDLEGLEWPEGRRPWDHPLLGGLLDSGLPDDEPGLDEEAPLDPLRPLEDSFEVCDADGSQLLALSEAARGRSMVIQGPPGTGKSQTITNLIADALARGRRVLFVAEKSAALEVVFRRLREAGLGDACLELHSGKTPRRAFYQELQRTVSLGRPRQEALQAELNQLGLTRERLNLFCQALHDPLPGRGLSPHALLGWMLSLPQPADPNQDVLMLTLPAMDGWSVDAFKSRLPVLERLQEKVARAGSPAQNPFFGLDRRLLLPTELPGLKADMASGLRAVQGVLELVSTLTPFLAPMTLVADAAWLDGLQLALAYLKEAPSLEGISLSPAVFMAGGDTLRQALLAGQRLQVLRKGLEPRVRPQAYSLELVPVRQNLATYGRRWWRMLSGLFRRARRQLFQVCLSQPPKGLEERLQLLDEVIEGQRCAREVGQASAAAQALFGVRWLGEQSDFTALIGVYDWLKGWHARQQAGSLPDGLAALVASAASSPAPSAGGLPAALALVPTLHTSLQTLRGQAASLATSLEARPTHALHRLTDLAGLKTLLETWIQQPAALQALTEFNLIAFEARGLDLGLAVEQAEKATDAGTVLVEQVTRGYLSLLLREAFQARAALAGFEPTSHGRSVQELRQLDDLFLVANRARVALAHYEGVPRHLAGGSLGLLQREFNKKTRHLPIRRAMAEASDAVLAIKPVFMMSPLSVALYLPPSGPHFDLVIFDEASQVKPEDAFGAIVRADQLIVVGDSRQMPPTSFFDRMTSGEEGEDEALETPNVTRDLESILALVDARLPPASPGRRDLRWHYRSRHHSLIEVSNRAFYQDRLVVFPNPTPASPSLGLFYRHLPQTVYGRAGARTNPDEAKAVVAAVLEHVRVKPELSLGVVAFSMAQQQLLQSLLDQAAGSEPALAAFDERHPFEKLFVKNLESVQGDERDVIFISLGYGRDASGKVSQNFGPLNQEGGERRLNVLITRARQRCEVFTNLAAQDLPLQEGSPAGVKALRAFLHYAATGELIDRSRLPESPVSLLEDQLKRLLEARGHKVEASVGQGGALVDLALRHPNQPDRFALGLLCDGPAYARARTARDRDKLRERVLEARGWKLLRVWSLRFWREPLKVVEEIEQALAATLASQAETVSPPPSAPQAGPAGPVAGEVAREVEPSSEAADEPVAYELANLMETLADRALEDLGEAELAELIAAVIEAESPVHVEAVLHRLTEATGERLAPKLKGAVWAALGLLEGQERVRVAGEFCWVLPERAAVPRSRSGLPAEERRFEWVCDEELWAAAAQVLEAAFGMPRGDLPSAMTRLLGFARATAAVKDRCLGLVDGWLEAGRLEEVEGRLKVV